MPVAERSLRTSPTTALVVVGFGIFVAADDLTVVTTMLRPIIGDLGIVLPDGLDDAAWIVNAYLIAFVAVIFRYVLDAALSWSFEASLILLTYLTFVGCFAALRRGAHLKVDVLAHALPPPARLVAFVAAQVVILAVCTVMVIWGAEQTMKFGSQTTTLIEMPRGPLYAIIPLSGLAMAIDTLARLVRGLRRAAQGEPPETEADSFSLDV